MNEVFDGPTFPGYGVRGEMGTAVGFGVPVQAEQTSTPAEVPQPSTYDKMVQDMDRLNRIITDAREAGALALSDPNLAPIFYL